MATINITVIGWSIMWCTSVVEFGGRCSRFLYFFLCILFFVFFVGMGFSESRRRKVAHGKCVF